MKKNKIFINFLIIILLFCLVIYIIPSLIILLIEKEKKIDIVQNKTPIYSIVDLYNVLQENQKFITSILDKEVVYEDEYVFTINISNYIEENIYEVEVYLDNEFIEKKEISLDDEIKIKLIEGKNNILLKFYHNSTLEQTDEYTIYRIEPYKRQFLDELSNKGITVHYRDGSLEDYSKSSDFLKSLGVKYARTDFLQWSITKNGKYDFSKYDAWIKDLTDTSDIKILAILNGLPKSLYGNDMKINSETEIDEYIDFFRNVTQYYPQIVDYEIMNELNLYSSTYKGAYFSEEEMYWYSKLMNKLENEIKNTRINIMTAGTTTPNENQSDRIMSEEFYSYYYNTGGMNICNNLSIHPYAINNIQSLKNKIKNHVQLFNSFGGFNYLNITEYGSTMQWLSEKNQAIDIIKQTVILEEQSDLIILYNLWTTGDSKSYEQFGILNKDYTPKLAYYAMKNYYENTNGAEYIGTIKNLESITNENLEAHVYDKDGKPKIIVWSNNSDVTITIPYLNFKATDLYGEEIQPDENGNLVITTSPVYLDEVDYNYFYQAISNMATEKYNEFTEKFAGEIAQVPELTSKIEENKKYMESVGQVENKIVGSATIQAMKNHFELGNLILQAYKDGKLQAEDVKISSMLDMLNNIGDSYEDLVTVSAQTVEKSEIEQTNKVMQETETIINNNPGCEIIYPVKILDFAKDHYEKATYINSLEGENDIKNGLIISNNLHASLLANWAKEFAQINIDKFVDEYITNNPVTIEYSTTEFTNQNVKATIKTNAEIQITNNSNSKEHTFEQNGSFTFEYTIKGRALNITATVQNIDKVAPSISGVQRAKLYTKPVTPKINDENLKEIKLILNSQIVSDYKNGDTLEEEGFYELTATDKAGNTTTTYFQIFINNDTNYKIEENYIKNVTNNTKKSDFDKKLNLSVDYKIYRNETELKQDDIIATGDVLTTEAGDNYTIIVPGDINKDGKVDLKDFIKMRIYLLLENNLDDIEMLAADCNNDNQPIGVKDYIRMRLIILMNDM